jgi:hypothetical protein
MNITKSAIASVTKEGWAGYSKHVQMLEQQYWEKDILLPYVNDNIIFLLGLQTARAVNPQSTVAVVTMTRTPTL